MSKRNKQVKSKGSWHGFSWTALVVPIVVMALVFFAYQSIFEHDFVNWDDDVYVYENPMVLDNEGSSVSDIFTNQVFLNYQPLTILSLSLNSNSCQDCILGISARPFLKWNLILHLFNCLLVFMLAYKLSRRQLLFAGIVAVIFGLHPMQVESVAWVSSRKNVLYALFFLLACLSYLRHLDVRAFKPFSKWFLLSLLFFLAACLSKATAVVFPLIALLIEWWMDPEEDALSSFKRTFNFSSVKRMAPFFLLSLLFGLLAIDLQSGGDAFGLLAAQAGSESAILEVPDQTLFERLQFAAYGFFMYLGRFFYPISLSAFHPYPESSTVHLIAFMGFFVFLGMIFRSLKRGKLFVFSFLFFLINIILILQIITVGSHLIAERFVYLAYIGLAIFTAIIFVRIAEQRSWLAYGLILLMTAAMFQQTKARVTVWKNGGTLWTNVLEQYPDCETALLNRGNYFGGLASANADQKIRMRLAGMAESDYRKAIEGGSQESKVLAGLASMCALKGDFKCSIENFDQAINFDPENGGLFFNRGVSYHMQGQLELAVADYDRAYGNFDKRKVDLLSFRSNALVKLRRFELAIKDLNELVQLEPRNPNHYHNRAIAKQGLGNESEAIQDFKQALEQDPGFQPSIQALAKANPR